MLHLDPQEIVTGVRHSAIDIRVGREDRGADNLLAFREFLLGSVIKPRWCLLPWQLRLSSRYPAQDNTNRHEQDDLLCSHQLLLAQKHYFRSRKKLILRSQPPTGDSAFLHEWRHQGLVSYRSLASRDKKISTRAARPQFNRIAGRGEKNSVEFRRTGASGKAWKMALDTEQVDIVFHYPPELTQLLIQTIPLLCPAKRDGMMFFRGSGVRDSVRADLPRVLGACGSVWRLLDFSLRRFSSHQLGFQQNALRRDGRAGFDQLQRQLASLLSNSGGLLVDAAERNF